MDLIGSYGISGFTVEAYFPEPDALDTWTIWVVRDGKVVEEFTTRIAADSVYGVDHRVMQMLEAAAEAAVQQVMGREASGDRREASPSRHRKPQEQHGQDGSGMRPARECACKERTGTDRDDRYKDAGGRHGSRPGRRGSMGQRRWR